MTTVHHLMSDKAPNGASRTTDHPLMHWPCRPTHLPAWVDLTIPGSKPSRGSRLPLLARVGSFIGTCSHPIRPSSQRSGEEGPLARAGLL